MTKRYLEELDFFMGDGTLTRIFLVLGACGMTLFLIPFCILASQRLSILSKIDFRRKSQKQIPLLGGVAIYISYFAASLTGVIYLNLNFDLTLTLVLCPLLLFAVGIVDDRLELGSKPKFIAQILTTFCWLYFIPTEKLMLAQIGIPAYLTYPITAFWMIGVTNAFNVIDGMDGLAGSLAVVAALFFAFVGEPTITVATLILAGACFGFLFFNKQPAKIYLGDSGSTFLGFTLAAVGSILVLPEKHAAYISIPLFLLVVPEVDMLVAMYRRKIRRLPLFKGDHDHIHHKLQKIGFSVSMTLSIIVISAIFASLTGALIYEMKDSQLISTLGLMNTGVLLSILAGIFYIEKRLVRQAAKYNNFLIESSYQFDSIPKFDPQNFFSITIDLTPYFEELYQSDLNKTCKFHRMLMEYFQAGSKDMGVSWYKVDAKSFVGISERTSDDLKFITQDFRFILEKLDLLKSTREIPDGIALFDSTNAKEFINYLNNNKVRYESHSTLQIAG